MEEWEADRVGEFLDSEERSVRDKFRGFLRGRVGAGGGRDVSIM